MSEQFEHNIRKKLQDAEAPFEPMAWERMEKLLDDPRRRRPIWWWLSGLVLVLGLAGWWFFHMSTVDNAGTSAKKESIAPDSSTSRIQNPEKNPSGGENATWPNNLPQSTQATNEKITDRNSEEEKLTVDKPGVQPVPTNSQGKISQGINDPVDNAIHPATSAFQKRTNPQDGKTDVDKPDIPPAPNFQKSEKATEARNHVDKPLIPATLAFQNDKNSQEEKKVVDNPAQTKLSSTEEEKSTAPATANVDKPVLPPVTTENKQTPHTGVPTDVNKSPLQDTSVMDPSSSDSWKAPRRKGFEGGIHLGPDINATNSFSGLHAGFTGGLLFRYHVNNRWYLSTGAAYTKKIYAASPKEYNAPYPANYVNIDADCDVIDVPLNVHYVFADRPSGRWNVSIGASSYFMLREKYEYYYPSNYKRTRVFSNQNQHWFSVINLSAGWEKNTKGRLNWGLQPYVKIPAGGVGEGKVKLYSAGVSLQLTLGKK